MLLTLALTIGIGIASSPQGSEITEPCDSAKEEEYLAALRDDELKANEPEWFVHAIECLGQLRSVAAVNPLIDLLSYRRTFWWDGTGAIPSLVLTLGRYPAGGALARIGEPALPRIIETVAASDSGSAESDVLLDILLTIFHYEREKGLLLLKKASIVARAETGRRRLLDMARRYAAVVKLGEP